MSLHNNTNENKNINKYDNCEKCNKCDNCEKCNKFNKKYIQKHVSFSEEKNIIILYTWQFASHSARIGKWEEVARDRERFRRRIHDIEILLEHILRDKISKF
ncbi:hypothetical protein [Dasineura jujubifolia toursvirus 2a]|nr:hypothetical protein [Dasineura jujubifolia toursvirus 2a]